MAKKPRGTTNAPNTLNEPLRKEEGHLDWAHRHLRIGWWSLLVFLTLGIGLEAMHAFKVQWYLRVGDEETRRLMFTLAHAHGVLIGLVHLAFAASVYMLPDWKSTTRSFASSCLTSAGIFLPLGFLLGGIWVYGGDPGVGVWLAPVGALLLFVAVLTTAQAVGRNRLST
ncbi:MAG: hypothetical protein MK165_13490 [Pirellulaceae bacterium]|nr:hypothetical protein [Pirellulaceae bacterium]